MDVKELIRGARRPEEPVPLCLRADLVGEYERAERELEAVRKAGRNSLEGAGEQAQVLEDRLAELREQMQASTLTVTLRALPPPAYRELVEAHPPRVTDDQVDRRDRVFGFNVDTFFPALVQACTVAPDLDDEDWEALAGDDGKLNDAQVGKLTDTAWKLNRKDADLPF